MIGEGITNEVILTWHAQIEELKNVGPIPHVLVAANSEWIIAFYNLNEEKIKILVRRIDEMHEKYFVMKAGKIQMKKMDQKLFPIMKPGMKHEDFEKELAALKKEKVSAIQVIKR